MAWIESHQEVGRHPKTKKLARLLGVSLPAAVGHLHYLWWWALDFAQDGVLDKYDSDDLAEAMEWDGDGDQLVGALISSGFVDETDHGLMIHDWGVYAGKLLERRAKDRARKRAAAEAAGVPKQIRGSSNGTDEESEETPTDYFVTNQPTNPNQPTVPIPTNSTNQMSDEPSLQERRFAEFWEEYPKKVGKKAAQTSWKRLKPDAELFERIMEAVTTAKTSEQWNREGGRFIPNPATWLNQGRWDDVLTPAGTPEKQSTKPSGNHNPFLTLLEGGIGE